MSLDRSLLNDPKRCPGCGAPLSGAVCGSCGIDLAGATGVQLWELSQQVERALHARDEVLVRLRQEAAATRAALPVPHVAVPRPPVRPAPVPMMPVPTAPVAPAPRMPVPMMAPPVQPPRPSLLARIGVQGLLVALGALLLAVAGVVFLVFAWDRLSLGARALVIAVITAAAMGAAAWLRPRLAETAEAIGAIGAVLVLADAWAVRATGLLGADRIDGAGYGALAAAGSTVILLGWALAGRVRAGSVTAAITAPAAAVLAGIWLGRAGLVSPDPFGLQLGLLAAAALAGARARTPQDWQVERIVLRLAAAASLGTAVLAAPGLWGRQGAATTVLALAAATSVLQAVADRARARPIRIGWSAAAGASAAAVALPASSGLLEFAGVDRRWLFAAMPVLAAAIALAAARLAGRGRPLDVLLHRPAVFSARFVAVALALPCAVVSGLLLVVAAAAARAPWSAGVGASLTAQLAREASDGSSTQAQTVTAAVAAVLGLAGLALLLAAGRPARWAIAVAAAGGLAAVALPVSLPLPRWLVCVLLLAAAVTGAALSVRSEQIFGPGRWRSRSARPTLLLAASVAVLEAVAISWTVRELSVPVTLVAVAGLLAARRVVPGAARPLLAVVAVPALAVVAGAAAGLLGARMLDRVTVASVAGALLAGLLAALTWPRRAAGDLPGAAAAARAAAVAGERFAGLLAGLAVSAVGVMAAVVDGALSGGGPSPGASGRLTLVLAAPWLAAVAAAAWPPKASSPAGSVPPVLMAAVVAPLGACTGAALASWITGPGGDREQWALIGGAAALAVCGLVLGVVGLRVALPGTAGAAAGPGPGGTDRRRIAAELGAVLPLAVLGLPALTAPSASASSDRGWLVLLLLGVGATADAMPADRRRVAWLGWALLTGSSWYRLHLADVGRLEAYTVPPALVLLAVSGLRLRRDRSTRAWSTLLPGLSLALLPSVLASARGSEVRPAVLIGLGAIAVLLAGRTGRRLDLVLLAAGAITSGATGAVRSLPSASSGGPASWQQLEQWSVPGALVLAAAALLLALRHPDLTRRAVGWAGVPALLLAIGPSLLAALTGGHDAGGDAAGWRAGSSLAASGAVALACTVLARPARGVREVLFGAAAPGGPLRATAVGTAALAALVGWAGTDLPAEVWTTPPAVLLLVIGAHTLRIGPQTGSWRALSAGLVLLLVPSLLLAIPGDVVWRIVALALVAGAVTVIGVVRRLQSPVLLGAAVLAAHAMFQLGPWVARTVAGQPRWVVLGLVGAALLALGATYERRLRELRAVRLRLATLR